MSGQGSAGNVISALCSFIIPGLGQLVQGRILAAIFHLVAAGILYFVTLGILGFIANILSCLDAALYKSKS